MLVFLVALVGAAIVALVLWKAMGTVRADGPGHGQGPVTRPTRPQVYGPDDDPDFLRQLGEKLRRRDEPPPPPAA
ncbi:MAG: hypothetical protein ACT4RN_22925 [Pseudonocardia sp.]